MAGQCALPFLEIHDSDFDVFEKVAAGQKNPTIGRNGWARQYFPSVIHRTKNHVFFLYERKKRVLNNDTSAEQIAKK